MNRMQELWADLVNAESDVVSEAEFLIQAHHMSDANKFDEFENTAHILMDTGNLDALYELFTMEVV